jgi:hypothetical protein
MQPRLRSDLRVQAIMRRATSAGAFTAIARKGHEIAGAVFVKAVLLDRTVRVFGPAPGPGTDDDGQPRWMCVTGAQPVAEVDADTYLARYANSDPDLWIVEIESGDGEACLDGVVIDETPSQTDPLITQIFSR